MRSETRRSFLHHLAAAGSAAALSAACPRLAPGAPAPAGDAYRFAICNETFESWPDDKACAVAAAAGYRGLEVAPYTLDKDARKISPARRAALRKAAERAGIEVIGLHWLLAKTEGYHITSPDAETRNRTVAYLEELARLCADLGGKVLVFGSPQQRNLLPGVDMAQGMKYAADVFGRLMPTLEKTGGVLALEPLPAFSTTFMRTAAEGVELATRIDSPHCRLHLDCRAMSSESEPIPDLLRKYRSWLYHFHANDPNGLGPGFGTLDFVPIFKTLREIDYRGWLSVEVFDLKPGPERIARDSVTYMRKCIAAAGQ